MRQIRTYKFLVRCEVAKVRHKIEENTKKLSYRLTCEGNITMKEGSPTQVCFQQQMFPNNRCQESISDIVNKMRKEKFYSNILYPAK